MHGSLVHYNSPNPRRTRADWILNSSLLSKAVVQTEIATEINNCFQVNNNCGVSLQVTWDALKAVLRGKFISLSSYYKKEREHLRICLLDKIKTLEHLHKRTCSKKTFKKLLQERKALELLEISAVQRKLYLLKQRSWYRSPKSLRYLSWRLKSKQKDRAVPIIRHHSGTHTTDLKDIANVFAEHYQSLYQSDFPHPKAIADYLANISSLPKLTLDDRDALDSPITAAEILETIKQLKAGKAPGRDGFPPDFYKSFSSVLTSPLLELFHQIQETGVLPPCWSESKIIVIHKSGTDPTRPGSYCPIAFLNQDYKILTGIFAARLNNFITNYIHPDQTGFMPKRNISDNIRKTLSLIHYAEYHQLPVLVQSLDITKAFDKLESSYLFQLLRVMGFGSGF